MDGDSLEARVATGPLAEMTADGLGVFLFEGYRPGPASSDPLEAAIRRVVELGDFQGKPNQTAITYPEGLGAPRLAVVGLGKAGDFHPDRARKAAGTAAVRLRDLGAKRLALGFHPAALATAGTAACGPVAEGALLGIYQLHEFRTERRDEIKAVTDLAIAAVAPDAADQHAVREASAVAAAVNWIRTLANRPGNAVTALGLADEARRMAETRGIRCQILDVSDMERLGMGCLLGVNAGSGDGARLIVLAYDGTDQGRPLALVGKGITFDSGGLCLKPRQGMEQMKDDMSGGGAVLGTLRAAADLGLRVRLVGVVPATDNMPGPRATKPGDVLRSLAGLTVEVVNTDAEGRLVLADALAYAVREFAPRAIVDLATLTGSIYVALGSVASGLFTLDDRMASVLLAAGEATGERVWRMPLWPEHRDLVRSDIADLRNQGEKGDSDAIAAAVFLARFAGDVPWAHLDIAGTSWADKKRPYVPKGATGVGVRLLIDALRNGL